MSAATRIGPRRGSRRKPPTEESWHRPRTRSGRRCGPQLAIDGEQACASCRQQLRKGRAAAGCLQGPREPGWAVSVHRRPGRRRKRVHRLRPLRRSRSARAADDSRESCRQRFPRPLRGRRHERRRSPWDVTGRVQIRCEPVRGRGPALASTNLASGIARLPRTNWWGCNGGPGSRRLRRGERRGGRGEQPRAEPGLRIGPRKPETGFVELPDWRPRSRSTLGNRPRSPPCWSPKGSASTRASPPRTPRSASPRRSGPSTRRSSTSRTAIRGPTSPPARPLDRDRSW